MPQDASGFSPRRMSHNEEVYGDMELAGILSRDPERTAKELVDSKVPAGIGNANNIEEIRRIAKRTDVMILCGGSKDDLPFDGPLYAAHCNTVCSFDNHERIPEYREMVGGVARFHDNVVIFSGGWDPGTGSKIRCDGEAFLPGSKPYAFYGLTEKGGSSQGHGSAIRSDPELKALGVIDARQYTHAKPEAIARVESGENPVLTPGDRLWRECVVVAKEGSNLDLIAEKIRKMPGYYAPYDRVEVRFTTPEDMAQNHRAMPHDGKFIVVAKTGMGNYAKIEYSNVWGSNPEGTGGILVACARAAYRISKEGRDLITKLEVAGVKDRKLLREIRGKYFGARTMLEVTNAQMHAHSIDQLMERVM